MKTKDEILQHIKNTELFKDRLDDMNEILCGLDNKYRKFTDNITKYEIEKYKGEDYIYYSTDERYYCGGYESDSGDFPLRYLWMGEEDIQIEVLEEKDKKMMEQLKEALEKNKEKEEEEKEKELKLLKELTKKYGNIL